MSKKQKYIFRMKCDISIFVVASDVTVFGAWHTGRCREGGTCK